MVRVIPPVVWYSYHIHDSQRHSIFPIHGFGRETVSEEHPILESE